MDDYPKGLIAAVKDAPVGAWIYTGALENRPDIVAKIDRALWGNPPEVLRRVRSPQLVHDCWTRHGLPFPALATGEPDPRRRWLVKPFRSAAGHGIRFWNPARRIDRRRSYLQEWIEGQSAAAIYVGQRDGSTMLLGVTEQLVGEPWLGAAPFHYCGSVGPLTLPAPAVTLLVKIGEALVHEFGLRGLFGIDFVLREGVPFPVEINPRYTASVEVLEIATGQALLAQHAVAFGGVELSASTRAAAPSPGAACVAKGILFARAAFTFPQRGPWESALRMALDAPAASYADIPAPGTPIQADQPICTVFARADSAATCLPALRDSIRGLERVLSPGSDSLSARRRC